MKKMILFLLSLSGVLLYGETPSTETLSVYTDGAFNKVYGHGWWLNRRVSSKAKASIVKEGSNAMLKIEVGEKGSAHICSDNSFVLDRKGTLHVSVKVKGEGTFNCGIYAYAAKNRFISSYAGKPVPVKTAEWTTLKFSYPLANVRKDGVTGKIVLFQSRKGTLLVDDIQCVMTRPVE